MIGELFALIGVSITINVALLLLILRLQALLDSEKNKATPQTDFAKKTNTELEQKLTVQTAKVAELQSKLAVYESRPQIPSQASPQPEVLLNAKREANKITTAAEAKAKSIVSEAQTQARALLAKQEKELQKSLVKIVIQVTKKVLGKTLTYEDHKKIIMDSFKEIS